jgi:hypothetical protein
MYPDKQVVWDTIERGIIMKKLLVVLVAGVMLVMLMGCNNAEREAAEAAHEEAVASFEAAVANAEEKNAELNATIDSLQAVIDSGDLPLDETTLLEAETSVTTARVSLVEIPEMPESTEDIQAATASLSPNYSKEINDLAEKQTALENSIKQLKQVTNPDEAFVVERLEGIETITGISAATEDNDPNGNLHKQGGYTSAVFFSNSQVNQDDVFGDTILEKGTDGGGSIEVYESVENAESRSTYLGSFDGSVLASGSHQVIGTILVRTSDKLTATQQNELTEQIIANLLELR